jgi:Ca-activated chloride channel family protein
MLYDGGALKTPRRARKKFQERSSVKKISASHTGLSIRRAPRALFAVAPLLLLFAPAHAASSKITKESIEYRGRTRTYYLYLPAKLDTSRPAPLVFTLHGSGGDGRSLVEKWRGLADEEGFIVVGPDALDPARWSIPEDGPDLLRDIANAVGAKRPVDVRRVYLFGHSAGANSAIPLGLFESEFFAAVAAHAGGMRPERYSLTSLARRKIPIVFVVGTNDTLALAVARATRDELQRQGFAPEMQEVAGHDHNYYARASKINRQVWDFFKQRKLTDEPRYIQYVWEVAPTTVEASGNVVREEPGIAIATPAREAPKAPPRLLDEQDAGTAETKASQTKKASPSARPTPDESADVDEVVRVNTSLVAVPVTVTDRDGRYVTDLRREEFHVFEDGVEQQIAFFEPVEKSITVALMLDVSDSTRFRIKDIQEAAIAFLGQLRPDDRIMIVAFDRRVQLLAEATNDRATLVEAIRRIQPGQGTSLFNALDMVIRQRLNSIRGRKAIVIFSDGEDTTSAGATYESNIENVEEFGGAVYTVRFDTWDSVERNAAASVSPAIAKEPSRLTRRSANELGATYLYEMAYRTGARALSADTGESLKEAFQKIADELRRQYALSYYPARPAAPGQRRKIKVRVDRNKVAVRARKSYVLQAGTDK